MLGELNRVHVKCDKVCQVYSCPEIFGYYGMSDSAGGQQGAGLPTEQPMKYISESIVDAKVVLPTQNWCQQSLFPSGSPPDQSV